MLIAFDGLPGTGRTTVARSQARRSHLPFQVAAAGQSAAPIIRWRRQRPLRMAGRV